MDDADVAEYDDAEDAEDAEDDDVDADDDIVGCFTQLIFDCVSCWHHERAG